MDASSTLVIPSRFNGPPTSGNGGYSAGALAAFFDGPAQVSLRSPPPLDTPLTVRDTGERLEVWTDETLVMYGRAKSPEGIVPSPPDYETAKRGSEHFPKQGHPLATCFVCGPDREPGDGLRVFAGPVEGFDGVADVWTPVANLADAEGNVWPAVMWAALDCPSFFPIPGRPFALLGAMCARVLRRARAGEPLIVVGWYRESDGRKHSTSSALFTSGGELLAHADTLWIELKSS